MSAVEGVATLLNQWLHAVRSAAVEARHLDAYLNEFTFRFNRRGALPETRFYDLIAQAAHTPPTRYKQFISEPRLSSPAIPRRDGLATYK